MQQAPRPEGLIECLESEFRGFIPPKPFPRPCSHGGRKQQALLYFGSYDRGFSSEKPLCFIVAVFGHCAAWGTWLGEGGLRVCGALGPPPRLTARPAALGGFFFFVILQIMSQGATFILQARGAAFPVAGPAAFQVCRLLPRSVGPSICRGRGLVAPFRYILHVGDVVRDTRVFARVEA